MAVYQKYLLRLVRTQLRIDVDNFFILLDLILRLIDLKSCTIFTILFADNYEDSLFKKKEIIDLKHCRRGGPPNATESCNEGKCPGI